VIRHFLCAIRERVLCPQILYSFVFFCFLFVEIDRINRPKIRTSGQTSISMHVLLPVAINPVTTHSVSFNNMSSGIVHAHIRVPCFLCIVEQVELQDRKSDFFPNSQSHSTAMQMVCILFLSLCLASVATYYSIIS